jgi:MFS family permease
MYPARFVGIGTVVFLVYFAENAAGFFFPKYLQDAHGWAPWHVSVMTFFGGFLAIFGSAYAGRLSDRHGRRRVGVFFLIAHPVFVVAFYQTFGWLLPPFWIGMIFCGIASNVILVAFGNELFPTSYRSTASGARMALGTAGGVLGLWVESALYGVVGSHWKAICFLVLPAVIAPLVVAAFFPETSGRALEEIAPER